MKRILVPTDDASDWQRQRTRAGKGWGEGPAAISAAGCWEDAATVLPPEIRSTLEAAGDPALAELSLLVAFPEWEIGLDDGPHDACANILAVASSETGLAIITVEAKVTESFGPTLGQQRQDASTEQLCRLEYLHTILELSTPLPDDIPYQFLHRTASAILTAHAFHAPTVATIIQSFSVTSDGWEDFSRFADALGVDLFPGVAARVPEHSRPKLFLGWARAKPDPSGTELRLLK